MIFGYQKNKKKNAPALGQTRSSQKRRHVHVHVHVHVFLVPARNRPQLNVCTLPIGLHGCSILPPRSSLPSPAQPVPRFRSVQHLALVPSRYPVFLTYFVEPLCLLVWVPYTVNSFFSLLFSRVHLHPLPPVASHRIHYRPGQQTDFLGILVCRPAAAPRGATLPPRPASNQP